MAHMVAELELIDPDGDVDAQADLMDAACSTLGFFRIPFDCVEQEVRDTAWLDARNFFAQPEHVKNLVRFPEDGYPYGFSPFRFESLAASRGTQTTPDLKESFSVGPDCQGPGPTDLSDGERWVRSPSMWPSTPPGLRRSWSAYYRALSEVSNKLLRIMAVALDLPADYFGPMTDRHTSAMRALHYPAVEETDPTSLRAGAHTDYGTLTILRTDGIPGLEVKSGDGTWKKIADQPNTFVVNLGDSIAQWTNDRWRSTLHRVTVASSSERQSMAFFHNANWDATIECLPSCTGPDNPPRYPPTAAGPWLQSKFQSTVG